jgi:hypothetical protein
VPFEVTIPHAFSTVSIRAHAPAAPGVYGISNARQWIYIGCAENIQIRLLEHLADRQSDINAYLPTGFIYEICEPLASNRRQDRLVMQYEPVLNRKGRALER